MTAFISTMTKYKNTYQDIKAWANTYFKDKSLRILAEYQTQIKDLQNVAAKGFDIYDDENIIGEPAPYLIYESSHKAIYQ